MLVPTQMYFPASLFLVLVIISFPLRTWTRKRERKRKSNRVTIETYLDNRILLGNELVGGKDLGITGRCV